MNEGVLSAAIDAQRHVLLPSASTDTPNLAACRKLLLSQLLLDLDADPSIIHYDPYCGDSQKGP